jgi:DNA processing protein
MNTDKLKAWLCLKQAPGLGQKTAQKLLAEFPDPTDYVGRSDHPVYELPWLQVSTKDALRRGEEIKGFAGIVKHCERYEIGITCLTDEDYPAALSSIYTPPIVLYYRGDLKTCEKLPILAVVGTRKPSSYGQEMARKLLAPLCERGVTIISGLAMGIDTVAHRVALGNGAKTIGVLAGGLESIYPPMNLNLANEIVANGLLLSEYEPGSKMEKWNFPARNRIISALAPAVFIVEGSITSGALLTGKFALEQGRDVCALPGNINNINAQGPNYMIKSGARAVTCPEDLMDLLDIEETDDLQTEIFPQLSPEEETIWLRLRESSSELSFDELMLGSGHNFGRLSVILLNLELKGLISKAGNGGYISN